MSTITAIFEPHADGTLHIPVPPDWRNTPIRVTAEMEPVSASVDSLSLKGYGCLQGKIHLAPDFDAPLEDFKEYSE